jgi:arsenite methyltransferase
MSDVTQDTPELARHYDRISDAQFISGRSLVEMMGVKAGDRVLDVGCGTGRLAIEVANLVGASGFVIGIDPSPQRIAIAQEKGSRQTNLKFMSGAAEDMGAIDDDSFDNVYFSSVFHWISDKDEALGEAYRVLKPGGRIGITMPSPDGISGVLRTVTSRIISRAPYAGHVKREPNRKLLITKEELRSLFFRTRFTGLDIKIEDRALFLDSAQRLIDFYSASSFGNFLRFVPEDLRDELKLEIASELEKERTADGIELVSKTIFAMAQKPD